MEYDIKEIVSACNLRHIAFIMDGNGRWAQKRGMPREYGHINGAKTFKKIARYCDDIGLRAMTVYAFSTENIKRPRIEVNAIIKLVYQYIDEAREETDVEFKFLGKPEALGEEIGKRSRKLEEDTKGGRFRINIALNYGGRAEIVDAVNRLIDSGKSSLTEEDISESLYTAGICDPDLIIRTGNEKRISNFLLWQSAYSELYFSEKMWPDFSPEDVDKAVLDFSGRNRRWGDVEHK